MNHASVKRDPGLLKTHPVGFHGDKYLLELVDSIASECDVFIETGCNVASTAFYVARNYPGLRVCSCEPDPQAFQAAQRVLSEHSDASVVNQPSPEFLYSLFEAEPELRTNRPLCWLDAHGYGYRWPLAEEIAFLTSRCGSAFLLIDDFQIPGRPEFVFDEYDGQVCGLDLVRPALTAGRRYQFILPEYTEHTSRHHPLVGTSLFVFGVEYTLPKALQGAFSSQWIDT